MSDTIRNESINRLAAFIRRIDGNHDMGTGELAERIVDDFEPAGTANTQSIDLDAYRRGAIERTELEVEVAKLRAERDEARREFREARDFGIGIGSADLAALRDKVRALADEWERGHLAGLVGGYGMTMTHKDALVARRLRALLTDGGQS